MHFNVFLCHYRGVYNFLYQPDICLDKLMLVGTYYNSATCQTKYLCACSVMKVIGSYVQIYKKLPATQGFCSEKWLAADHYNHLWYVCVDVGVYICQSIYLTVCLCL